MNRKADVLIVCTGNSCRSQMAEGFLRQMASDRLNALSAGLDPKGDVHPLAVKAMDEIGINIHQQVPKDISEFLGKEAIRYLVIVCNKANRTCPRIWPGLADENRLYWPFDDPADAVGTEEEQMEVFRRVRDEIKTKLEEWLATLEDYLAPNKISNF